LPCAGSITQHQANSSAACPHELPRCDAGSIRYQQRARARVCVCVCVCVRARARACGVCVCVCCASLAAATTTLVCAALAAGLRDAHCCFDSQACLCIARGTHVVGVARHCVKAFDDVCSAVDCHSDFSSHDVRGKFYPARVLLVTDRLQGPPATSSSASERRVQSSWGSQRTNSSSSGCR
jgi:hypothetical protein